MRIVPKMLASISPTKIRMLHSVNPTLMILFFK